MGEKMLEEEKFKRKRLIILILIQIGIYFGSLHSWSGIFGGIIFLLLGSILPTLINLSISYLIAFYCTGGIRDSIKCLIFVLISFTLGVNTKLVDIFPLKDANENIEVLKPLRVINNPKIYIKKPDNLDLKVSPFIPFSVGSDEACMCMYFKSTKSLLRQSLFTLINMIEKNAGGIIETYSSRRADYQIIYEAKTEKGEIHLKSTILDQYGGHVVIKNIYPASLSFTDEFNGMNRNGNLSGLYFWKYASMLLMNDNIWQRITMDNLKPLDIFSIFNMTTS